MKTTKTSWLITICVLTLVKNSCAGADAAKRMDPDVDALATAAGLNDTVFLDVPIVAPVAECELFVEGYRDGKVAFNSRAASSGSIKSTPPMLVRLIRVCVCLRDEQPSRYEWSQEKHRTERVPGTGSTRLGFSYSMIGDEGVSGSGGKSIISHAEFDFPKMRGGLKADDLPFTIVARHHAYAVPILVYFPWKVHIASLKGTLDASALPNGTVVVYANIKKDP